MEKLDLTKEEAKCVAEVVQSVVDLNLLKGAPIEVKRNIKNGLTKLRAFISDAEKETLP